MGHGTGWCGRRRSSPSPSLSDHWFSLCNTHRKSPPNRENKRALHQHHHHPPSFELYQPIHLQHSRQTTKERGAGENNNCAAYRIDWFSFQIDILRRKKLVTERRLNHGTTWKLFHHHLSPKWNRSETVWSMWSASYKSIKNCWHDINIFKRIDPW